MVRAMKRQRSLVEYWLWLGVAAIGAAGIYAVVPLAGRSPDLAWLHMTQQLFDVMLVVHVDLSTMVWFFSAICMGAAGLMAPHATRWPYWGKAGFWCVALATALMALAPLGSWEPVKSNYIPVLHNLMFLLSLGLLAAGLLVSLIPPLVTYIQPRYADSLQVPEWGFFWAVVTVLIGLFGYALGAQTLPPTKDMTQHYELLFWLGGHIMQFAYTLVLMAAWWTLVEAIGGALPRRRIANAIYAIAVVGAMVSYLAFAFDAQDVIDRKYQQTRMMIEWGGVSPTLMALLIIFSLLRTRFTYENRAYATSLIASIALFFAGGAIGMMIVGQNVTIPGHYHAVIGGITQALMGLAFVMLPRLGFASIAHKRLALIQPILYSSGVLMHAGGLAYSGGYGILRKTVGGFSQLAPDLKVAFIVFETGGLLAITGGILFVVVMLTAKRSTSASHQP